MTEPSQAFALFAHLLPAMGKVVRFVTVNAPLWVALGLALQLLHCFAMQVIADKVGVRHSWMAWVPLLQAYPFLKSGDGSLRTVALLTLGPFVLIVITALVGGPFVVVAVVVAVLAWSGLMTIYLPRILWNTARARGLSGWAGLFCLIPLVGSAVYLRIAFYDGFEPPKPVGLLLGLVFFGLPSIPSFQQAREVARQGAALAALLERGVPGALPGAALGRLLQNPVPDQPSTRLHPGSSRAAARAAALPKASAGSTRIDDPRWARARARLELPQGFDPERGFPVPEPAPCPPGTEERGAPPPQGHELYCEKVLPDGRRLRHGTYVAWYANGVRSEQGRYRDGQRVGVWTRWYPNGVKKVQAQFRNGVQDGLLLTWNENGVKEHEILFAGGEPVAR